MLLLIHYIFGYFRATLRRGFAFSSSIKNPPLTKTRNIQSQSSFTTSSAGTQIAATSSSSSSVTDLPVSSFGLETITIPNNSRPFRNLSKQNNQLFQKSSETDV